MEFIEKLQIVMYWPIYIDISEELRSKEVEISILPYETMGSVDLKERKKKKVQGALARYKNEELQENENEVWSNGAVGKHENS